MSMLVFVSLNYDYRTSFFKCAIPGLFLFSFFKQTIQFLPQINVRKSSISCWDLNPQPSEHESRPITTRPGPAHYRTS